MFPKADHLTFKIIFHLGEYINMHFTSVLEILSKFLLWTEKVFLKHSHTKQIHSVHFFFKQYQNTYNLCLAKFTLLTASVFPEPVCAIPTISLPLMAIGQPWAWMAVGSSNPCLLQRKLMISTITMYHLFGTEITWLQITWFHSWHSQENSPLQNQGSGVEHYCLSLLFPCKICIWLLHALAWNKFNIEITTYSSVLCPALHKLCLTF